MAPASHVRSAAVQIGAPTTLTKVEGIFPEKAMAVSDGIVFPSLATCTHNLPSVCSVCTSVPEQHPSVTTALKHLKFHKMPSAAKTPVGLTISPPVQTIVVDGVLVVNPQLAAIIRDNTEPVVACPEDSHAACPTHSKVIASGKTRPFTTCIAVVHHMSPTSHVWFATVEVLTAATLTKVEDVLPEEARAISDLIPGLTSATGTHNHPSVSSIATPVPEQHPSMATTLKHFKPHKMPPGAKMTGSLTIAPAVQAIIVDCVLVVDPQLAAVIGVNTETVMACLEDP